MQCKYCKNEIIDDRRFCPECGKEIEQSPKSRFIKGDVVQRRKFDFKALSAAVGGTLGGLFILWLLGNFFKEPDAQIPPFRYVIMAIVFGASGLILFKTRRRSHDVLSAWVVILTDIALIALFYFIAFIQNQ